MSSFTVLAVLAAIIALSTAQQQPPPPPFLQGQPQAVVDSFHQVLQKGHGMTDAALDKEVEAWIGTQSAQVKTKYAQFKNELKSHQQNAEKAHQQSIAKFSPEAKAADAKLSAIANNPSLTAGQKNQQIEEFVKGLPASVRKEIESAMQG
ncbi:DUF148 domain-containing protein [Aphelenchoides besseyi]|nr:DUF148 domain-containing protein [Aphelenchoides besseyi]KAI6194049.1 DUF148 domain-containing protein [Aphelenchoides besseyi]